jgi:hypothetical protein
VSGARRFHPRFHLYFVSPSFASGGTAADLCFREDDDEDESDD